MSRADFSPETNDRLLKLRKLYEEAVHHTAAINCLATREDRLTLLVEESRELLPDIELQLEHVLLNQIENLLTRVREEQSEAFWRSQGVLDDAGQLILLQMRKRVTARSGQLLRMLEASRLIEANMLERHDQDESIAFCDIDEIVWIDQNAESHHLSADQVSGIFDEALTAGDVPDAAWRAIQELSTPSEATD